MRISLNEPQHNVFSYISFSQVGREILSVNVHTWDLAVLVDGESVVGDRTVEVEVESHGGADAEALEAALAAQSHVRAVAICHGEVVVLA